MGNQREVVVIGAGHNGLVTAFYLARAGKRPLVLERRAVVGGTAITGEFHPGFRCSTLAHLTGPVRADVLADMALERHGLQLLRSDAALFVPDPEGRALSLPADPGRAAAAITSLSHRDGQRFAEFHDTLSRIGTALGRLMALIPPDIDHPSVRDLIGLLDAGRRIRGLGRADIYRLLRWGPVSAADLVAEWFENDLLQASIAARGLLGTFMGPMSAGTGAVIMLRAAADPHGLGTVVVPRGGMGELTRAMASAAQGAGAEIRTSAEVEQIVVKDGRAQSVVLTNGEQIQARTIVSNADPRRTLLRLVDPALLEPDVRNRYADYRCEGAVAKVNLALSALPKFAALASANGGTPAGSAALQGRIHIGPAVEYLERAFDDAKYGDLSKRPFLEVTIPTLIDPSLAPEGRHVMSILVQYAPYRLKTGDWESRRKDLVDIVVRTLAVYAPDLPDLILHGESLTPRDLENDFSLTGGHMFHGEETLDQLFTMRPVIGWGRYATPVRGLYLCGAGTHPGGGITGASGANAARAILRSGGGV